MASAVEHLAELSARSVEEFIDAGPQGFWSGLWDGIVGAWNGFTGP